jgi:peptide/nickel transport system permease protein
MTISTSSSQNTTAPVAPVVKEQGPWRRFAGDFLASKLATLGLVVLVLMVGSALLAPWIAPQNPYDIGTLDIMDSKLPPLSQNMAGDMTYWLGTDGQARDMLSAILYGLRTSLMVGCISVFFAFVIGATVGLVAAYFGGRIDALLMRIADIQLSFPSILVALILLAILGSGVDKVIIALIVVQWAYFARTARGAALVERNRNTSRRRDACLWVPAASCGATCFPTACRR